MNPRALTWPKRVGRVPAIRAAYFILLSVRDAVAYSPDWSQRGLDAEFERVNPWRYDSAMERDRHALALRLLDAVAPEAGWTRALEIGCAEGHFTGHLAARCGQLVAMDSSAVALARARRAVQGATVTFQHVDILRGALTSGAFDLVTAMDVLSYIHRPSRLRAACETIIHAVASGGCLLFCDVRQSKDFEQGWWTRYALRGGWQIRRLLCVMPELTLVSFHETETHVFALFRRR